MVKKIVIVFMFTCSVLFIGCEKETIYESNFSEVQITAKNLSGTWISPFDIKTPDNVPKSIFKNLRIVFTVDNNGLPDKFFCEGANDIFKSGIGKWDFINNNVKQIYLDGIGPISAFNIDTSTINRLKIWFTTTWEDSKGNSGKGLFEATLMRYGTQ